MKDFILTMAHRERWALGVCLLLAGIIASTQSMAAEWSVKPSVVVKEEYNDNINLTTVPHNSVWSTTLSPSIEFGGRSEILKVAGGAKFNFNRYSGQTGIDTNDQFFTLTSEYKLERDTFGLNASYIRDSTRDSEKEITGYVLARKQRGALNMAPSWTKLISERLKLTASYQYTDVKYETSPNLTNYNQQKISGVLQYNWSENDQGFLVASNEKVEYSSATSSVPIRIDGYITVNIFPLGNVEIPVYGGGGQYTLSGNKAKTQNFLVGLTHAFSETLQATLKMGRRSTRSSVIKTCNGLAGECTYNDNPSDVDPIITFGSESRTSGSSFEAMLDKQFENIKVSGQASRYLNASGSGLVETDLFGVTISDNLSETVSGSLKVSNYQTKYLGNVAGNSNSRYYLISPALTWRVTEWWTMKSGYSYARQKSENSSSSATANSIYVNLSYSWPKIAVSR